MPPPWASDAAWSEGAHGWPGGGDGPWVPPAARLWLPVVVSFLAQVPAVVFLAWHGPARSGWPLVVGLALVGPAALIGARRFPGPVVAVVAAAAGALLLLRPDIGAPYPAVLFAIVLGIVRGARVWVYASVAVAWAATITLASVYGVTFHPLRIAFTTLALALAMGIGEAIRSRREHFQALRRGVDARRMSAEQRERVRIARELHDVLAHSLSQINVQAGVGLHLIDTQPEKAAEALASIKATSKNALGEVRTVLGILRSDPTEESTAPLAPEPDLAGLPGLIDSFREQRMQVEYVNALGGEAAAVPAATQLALYRICQEALTNVLRHARGSAASVRLAVDRGFYLLSVTDAGTMEPGEGPITPGGGLLGMRERAELLGGSLQVARGHRGGVRVEARIPVRGAR